MDLEYSDLMGRGTIVVAGGTMDCRRTWFQTLRTTCPLKSGRKAI